MVDQAFLEKKKKEKESENVGSARIVFRAL